MSLQPADDHPGDARYSYFAGAYADYVEQEAEDPPPGVTEVKGQELRTGGWPSTPITMDASITGSGLLLAMLPTVFLTGPCCVQS